MASSFLVSRSLQNLTCEIRVSEMLELSQLNSASHLVSKTQHLHLHLQTDLALSLLLLTLLFLICSLHHLRLLAYGLLITGLLSGPSAIQLCPPGEMSPNKLGETVQICSTQTERNEKKSQHSSFKR